MSRVEEVLSFWLGAPAADAAAFKTKLRRWYMGGPELDGEIVERFGADVERAIAGELDDWAAEPRGALALVILLDQFARNVFRDQARAYAGDARAIATAERGLASGAAFSPEERVFLAMPFVHSENLAHQERGLAVTKETVAAAPSDQRELYAMGIEQSEKYRTIIARFGRFPHRNAILGRTSTPEEEQFMTEWAAKMPPSGMRQGG